MAVIAPNGPYKIQQTLPSSSLVRGPFSTRPPRYARSAAPGTLVRSGGPSEAGPASAASTNRRVEAGAAVRGRGRSDRLSARAHVLSGQLLLAHGLDPLAPGAQGGARHRGRRALGTGPGRSSKERPLRRGASRPGPRVRGSRKPYALPGNDCKTRDVLENRDMPSALGRCNRKM